MPAIPNPGITRISSRINIIPAKRIKTSVISASPTKRWDPKKKKWYYKTEDVNNYYSKLTDNNMIKLIELFT